MGEFRSLYHITWVLTRQCMRGRLGNRGQERALETMHVNSRGHTVELGVAMVREEARGVAKRQLLLERRVIRGVQLIALGAK
jgi:hypothetical protein